MAYLINLQTYTDVRGNLTVIDKVIPFDFIRIFYIYGVDESSRGGHMHKETTQAAICLRGKCRIRGNNRKEKFSFNMDSPSKCLIINPEDWHVMEEFSPDAILMVIASTNFNPDDYIYTNYMEIEDSKSS